MIVGLGMYDLKCTYTTMRTSKRDYYNLFSNAKLGLAFSIGIGSGLYHADCTHTNDADDLP